FYILYLFFFILSTGGWSILSAAAVPETANYREDFNGDGRINIQDVIALMLLIRSDSVNADGDYNGDGSCGITDVVLMLGNIMSGRLTPVESGPAPVEPGASAPVAGPLVTSGNWPRTTDLVTWVRDVFRLDGVEDASETRKGISFYTWLRLFSRNCYGGMPQAYEGLPGAEGYVTDAHKNLFVYGWGYCDTHCRIGEAVWRELTGEPESAYRVNVGNPGGGYHTMLRLRLDGNYGAFDPLYGYYLIDRDDSVNMRILDWAEVGVDSNVTRNAKFVNRCKPFFEIPSWNKSTVLGYEPVYWEEETDWAAAGSPIKQVFSSPKHETGTVYHDMNWRLPRGTTIRRYWKSSGKKWYVPLKRKSDFLSSGRFYRVTNKSFESNWPRYDPNYKRAKAYLEKVPRGEYYQWWMEGGLTIGQAYGRIDYKPDLAGDSWLDALAGASNLAHQSRAPYLIPQEAGKQCEAVFDFYCPFIMVEGLFMGKLAGLEGDQVSLEFRSLAPKRLSRSESDSWTGWTEITSGEGSFSKRFDRTEY
ncbi:MAG: hypothetical protein U9N45_06500, partial [Gemmatimonadota bacterium]|nr:hypothetical protein [Gemmatimonadota bacterium]